MSDLHLGTTSGADVARREEPLTRLTEVLADADRVVFLGDLLELRERPVAATLADVDTVLRRLGEATAGKQVVIVPGNHDHQLVAPALERARLAGGAPLAHDTIHRPTPGELSGHVADLMPRSDIVLGYPGVRLRDDVYALHGHYLDLHLTVPRIECLVAAAVRRYASSVGSDGPTSAEQYEAILAPIYAASYAFAQNAQPRSVTRGNSLSRRVWGTATQSDGAGGKLRATLLGRAAIPAAVAGINALGLGPFKSDISAIELRRAGLLAIGAVVERLEIDADHVIFGHTHRAGPLDGDADGWQLPSGTRLTNTGSWIHETILMDGSSRPTSPYWPGRVTLLGESGPPELRSLLDGLSLAFVGG